MIAIAATIAAAVAAGMHAEHRWGAGARRASRLVLTAMLYGLVPFVAFVNIAHLHVSVNTGGGIALAWVALGLACLTAYLVGSRVLRLARPSTGALMCATMQANTGYLGLPLAAALLGFGRLGQAVAYDSLVQSPSMFLAGFAIGAGFGTRAGTGAREKLASFVRRNPPLLAVVAGFLAPAALAPHALVQASHVVVLALLPLGFFTVGVTLAAEAEEQRAVRFPPPFTRTIAVALALRLVLAPALLLVLASLLIDLPAPYLLLAAMPVGINTLVIGHAYGLDLGLAASAIAWSTALVVVVGLVATTLT